MRNANVTTIKTTMTAMEEAHVLRSQLSTAWAEIAEMQKTIRLIGGLLDQRDAELEQLKASLLPSIAA